MIISLRAFYSERLLLGCISAILLVLFLSFLFFEVLDIDGSASIAGYALEDGLFRVQTKLMPVFLGALQAFRIHDLCRSLDPAAGEEILFRYQTLLSATLTASQRLGRFRASVLPSRRFP